MKNIFKTQSIYIFWIKYYITKLKIFNVKVGNIRPRKIKVDS